MDEHGDQVRISPVKATAVMVAVAVVGGILVFAASQWFFGQPAPAAEALTITGYDATDGDCLQDHEGSPVFACAEGVDASSNGGMAAGDALTIYVHNAGAGQIQVTLVEVAGAVHLPDAPGAEAPATGRFVLLDLTAGEPGVEGGTSKTILVRYGGADIGNGNIVTAVVEAGGEIFTAPVSIGERTA